LDICFWEPSVLTNISGVNIGEEREIFLQLHSLPGKLQKMNWTLIEINKKKGGFFSQ
jgi:hypothetical protein